MLKRSVRETKAMLSKGESHARLVCVLVGLAAGVLALMGLGWEALDREHQGRALVVVNATASEIVDVSIEGDAERHMLRRVHAHDAVTIQVARAWPRGGSLLSFSWTTTDGKPHRYGVLMGDAAEKRGDVSEYVAVVLDDRVELVAGVSQEDYQPDTLPPHHPLGHPKARIEAGPRGYFRPEWLLPTEAMDYLMGSPLEYEKARALLESVGFREYIYFRDSSSKVVVNNVVFSGRDEAFQYVSELGVRSLLYLPGRQLDKVPAQHRIPGVKYRFLPSSISESDDVSPEGPVGSKD